MKAPHGRSFAAIALQFRFPNATALPPFTRQLMQKAKTEAAKAPIATGELVVEPTEGVCLLDFLADIEHAGYKLVNAICEARSNTSGPLNKQHFVAKFIFSKDASAESVSDVFARRVSTIRRELQQICKSALWKVKAFSKPFVIGDAVVEGVRGASIVLDTRQPYYQGNGEPVSTWLKDGEGERIGDAPVPLAASYKLRASGKVQSFVLAQA